MSKCDYTTASRPRSPRVTNAIICRSARRQAGDSWALDIAAHDWKLPVGLPLQFNRLESTAIASATGIEAKRVSGSLYGGSFSGPVAVSWKSGWSVAGQGRIDGVDLEPIVALLKREVAYQVAERSRELGAAASRSERAFLEPSANFSARSTSPGWPSMTSGSKTVAAHIVAALGRVPDTSERVVVDGLEVEIEVVEAGTIASVIVGTPHTRGRDHLHRFGDLLRRLDRADPPADVNQ